MARPETAFRNNKVNPFLKRLKISWSTSIQQLSIRGIPDKILCVRGKFAVMELKKAGGKPTELQLQNLYLIDKAGGIAIVASPDNWEEVKTFLTKLAEGEDVTWDKKEWYSLINPLFLATNFGQR